MKISELEKLLIKIRKKDGDLDVKCFDLNGDESDVYELIVNKIYETNMCKITVEIHGTPSTYI